MASKALTARLSSAALVVLVTLGSAGCAQERLKVADTCDEYNAIVNGGDFSAEETEAMLKDLEDRAAAPFQDAVRTAAGFFGRGGNQVAEMTDEDRAADQLFSEQCPSDQ